MCCLLVVCLAVSILASPIEVQTNEHSRVKRSFRGGGGGFRGGRGGFGAGFGGFGGLGFIGGVGFGIPMVVPMMPAAVVPMIPAFGAPFIG